FVGIDRAVRVNGLHLALHRTQLTRRTALFATLEPIEQTQLGGNSQGGTQWTDIAAIDFAGENINHQQRYRIQNEPPLTIKLKRNRCFKWLNFCVLLSSRHRLKGDAKQDQQNNIFDRPESLMQSKRHFVLRDFYLTRNLINNFLQSTKWTEPAAEHAASPQQDNCSCDSPQNKDDRVA